MPKRRYNLAGREVLRLKLAEDQTPRKTVSFYRYVSIEYPQVFRDTLYDDWEGIDVLGRTYIASEGINAQVSVPSESWENFTESLEARECLAGMDLREAIEEGKSFFKLIIKVRSRIVADGIDDPSFDPSRTGKSLTAAQFHEAMDKGAVVVDVRNRYESEVGHFQGAILPEAVTFREELQLLPQILKGKENDKVLLYCTGGIRCEKAGAWLRHIGFSDVSQLRGGIIGYSHEVTAKNMESRFVGKNFVFDERLGERVTDVVISRCHICGNPCDIHTNCANDACHLLFIQCTVCAEKYLGCCSEDCRGIIQLPRTEQIRLRKGQTGERNVHHSRRLPGPSYQMMP